MIKVNSRQSKHTKTRKYYGGNRENINNAINAININLLKEALESDLATINDIDPQSGQTYLQFAIQVYRGKYINLVLRSGSQTLLTDNGHVANVVGFYNSIENKQVLKDMREIIKYLFSKGAEINDTDIKKLYNEVPLLKELLYKEKHKQKFIKPVNRTSAPGLLTMHYGQLGRNEEPTNNRSLKKNIEYLKLYDEMTDPEIYRGILGPNPQNEPIEEFQKRLDTYYDGGPSVEGVGTGTSQPLTQLERRLAVSRQKMKNSEKSEKSERRKTRKTKKSRKSRK